MNDTKYKFVSLEAERICDTVHWMATVRGTSERDIHRQNIRLLKEHQSRMMPGSSAYERAERSIQQLKARL